MDGAHGGAHGVDVPLQVFDGLIVGLDVPFHLAREHLSSLDHVGHICHRVSDCEAKRVSDCGVAATVSGRESYVEAT